MTTTGGSTKPKAKNHGFKIEIPNCVDENTAPTLLNVYEDAIIDYNGDKIRINKKMFVDIRKLGSGRFGHVMLVEIKNHPNIQMAVKRLNLLASTNNPDDYTAPTDLNTIRTVGSGDNSHVTIFYAAVIDHELSNLVICMEACRTSMEKFSKAMHQMKETKHLDLLLKRMINHIVDALCFLKSKHILHRDVKPSNILINQNPVIFKLCDFGMCGQLVHSVTHTMTKGTKIYLALERIDKNKSPGGYGIRSDMWALGLSTLEIASNEHPFLGMEETAIAGKLKTWLPEPPSSLTTDLQQLMVSLLAIDQNDRPAKYDDILVTSAMRSLPQQITHEEIEMVKNVLERVPLVPDESI